MDTVAEQKLRRFRVLKFLYERSGGNELQHVSHEEVMQHCGLSEDEFRSAFLYLINEDLISGTHGTICLSHTGVVEVEAAISQPDVATEHFPVNVIHIEQMSNSQIQQSTINSTQNGQFELRDMTAIAEFISGLKTQLSQLGLTGDSEAEALSDLATIENQLSSPRPKAGIIKESMRSIRNIAEGTAGSLAASGIISEISKLIGF